MKRALLVVCAAALGRGGPAVQFQVVPHAGSWYRGNTHAHTTESDGDSSPAYVAQWYKDHGDDFLVLSDHNAFTDPATLADLVDSTFPLIPGEEVTSSFQNAAVHVNGLNIPHVIEARTAESLVATIQANVDAVREVEGVPHINHPNFRWLFGAEELRQIERDKLLEIRNGHPTVHNEGGGGTAGLEEVWDVFLTGGKRIYGIAVDDAHHFQGEFAADRANPGRGWIEVRAPTLDVLGVLDAVGGDDRLPDFTEGLFLNIGTRSRRLLNNDPQPVAAMPRFMNGLEHLARLSSMRDGGASMPPRRLADILEEGTKELARALGKPTERHLASLIRYRDPSPESQASSLRGCGGLRSAAHTVTESHRVRRARSTAVAFSSALVGVAGCAASSDETSAGGQSAEVTPSAGIEVEYIAHAAFLLRATDGTDLLIDPYASRVWLGYDWPSAVAPAAVLITHPHYDHDAGRYRDMPFPWGANVPVVDEPGTHTFGDFTVTGVRGKHADPYGVEFGQLNTLMIVEAAGLRIVHLGDNGPLTPAMVDGLGRVDVLMMPADGVDHILSKETTAEILSALDPRVVIPMHYRLPALESDPDSPSDLGDIDAWLEGHEGIRRVGSHITTLSRAVLPATREILVFDHAPYVRGPGGGA